MLYVYYGGDTKKAEKKFTTTLKSLISKKSDASVFQFDEENFQEGRFEELLFGQLLFDDRYIVACRRILENKLACEFVENKVKDIAESPHVFIFYEANIDKKVITKLNKYANKVEAFDQKILKEKSEFNIFSLSDALANRDRKKLWVTYTQALFWGIEAEEIFWQFQRTVKNLLLVKNSKDKKSLGLHPFVLQKTEKASNNFSSEELSSFSTKLAGIFHDVRLGKREMETALELFVMEV